MYLLGLIGDNIAASSAPRLHHLAGRLAGLDVRYELLVPREEGLAFEPLFERCATGGYTGINVTYPYKERAVPRCRVDDPRERAIGSVNTVVFADGLALGFNTDFSGFVAGYRHRFGDERPGEVAVVGAGGVGKAVGFGLGDLGAAGIRVVDRDAGKAAELAAALAAAGYPARAATDVGEACDGADGVANCTPLGMVGNPGTPVPAALLGGRRWAFDAVYTPLETAFLADAGQAGLAILSGYELFFYQGLHAFERFFGRAPEEAELRAALGPPRE